MKNFKKSKNKTSKTKTPEHFSYVSAVYSSSTEIAKGYDIELEEIAEKASDIISQIKDVQTDTDDLFEYPLRKLLGLDKQLRSIRGSLKVEVAKNFSWKSTSLKSVES